MSISDGPARSTQVDALFEMVRGKYGGRLSDDELAAVRKEVEAVVEHAEALRSVKLDNSDEPPFIFQPYRKEG